MKVKFYITSSGRSPVEDFLELLSVELKGEFLDAVLLLEEGKSLSMPLNRNLSSVFKGLNEIRLKDRTGNYRFFYFIKKTDGIYFIHAFKKKSSQIPLKEIKLVIKRLNEVP